MLIKNKIESIKYTLKHRKAFMILEKQILGKNTVRGYIHDLDKIVLKLIFNPTITSKIHRKISNHHYPNAKSREDYIQMIIDWECARETKPDKLLNARDTLYQYYPQLIKEVEILLDEFNM